MAQPVSALTSATHIAIREANPDLSDEQIADISARTRAIIADMIASQAAAFIAKCVEKKHPGSQPRTERRRAQACPQCNFTLLGIQTSATLVDSAVYSR